MERKMTYKLSCRLFTDAKCFGPGVVQLLHAVQQLHSLRAAALSMDMAYSKAWTIVKNSEKALGFPLLTSTTGGKGGGGAALTPGACSCWTPTIHSAKGSKMRQLHCLMKNFPIFSEKRVNAGAPAT